MDKKKLFKVAVASTDGKEVDSHFGKATLFYIYENHPEDDSWKLTEQRKVTPVCDGGNHDDTRLQEQVENFSDCKYILVSKIGWSAENALEEEDIHSLELPGTITEALDKLIKYEKLQQLIQQR